MRPVLDFVGANFCDIVHNIRLNVPSRRNSVGRISIITNFYQCVPQEFGPHGEKIILFS